MPGLFSKQLGADLMETTHQTYYRIHWLLANNQVRFNKAELYESMSAAIAAAETIKAELGAAYAPLARRWMVDADYEIVEVRVTVREHMTTTRQ
jgi:hypothetical protein